MLILEGIGLGFLALAALCFSVSMVIEHRLNAHRLPDAPWFSWFIVPTAEFYEPEVHDRVRSARAFHWASYVFFPIGAILYIMTA